MTIACVIPTYNQAHLIGRAIDSVLAQTVPVDEIIVIDDGSSDSTREVVAGYGPRIRYIYQKNAGGAAARNTGVREARSEWIAFLDADDEWLPTKTEKQARCLEQAGNAALCYGRAWYHRLDGRDGLSFHQPPEQLWPAIRLSNHIFPSMIMVRRDVYLEVGGFNESLRNSCEDWDLFVRLAYRYRVVSVPEPLMHYYLVPGSASLAYRKMLDGELAILDSLLLGLSGANRALWKRRIASLMHYRGAIAAREAGHSSLPYLARSLACWPSPLLAPMRYATLAILLRDVLLRSKRHSQAYRPVSPR